MHQPKIAAAIPLIAALFSVCQSDLAQDSPAQPPAEAEIARQFEAAAPGLYKEWIFHRPEALKSLGEGQYGKVGDRTLHYCFEFVVCEDAPPPTTYSIDVRKTDSILTPFVGTVIVPVKLSCTNRVLTSSVRKKSADALAPSCIGHTYQDCANAGGKPPSGFSKFNKVLGGGGPCTGGDGVTFRYEDEVRISFAWRQGKWEFQDEKQKRPRDANVNNS